MKTVKTRCANCGSEFEKRVADYNRTERRGKRHYCGLKCSATVRNKEFPSSPSCANHLISGNRRDIHTPFRWFVKVAKQRCNKQGKTNLTVDYLEGLWGSQSGKCPFTGWQLELPHSTIGWKSDVNGRTKRASLDRIDCEKGYVEGNVRFISVMANLARQAYSDEEVIEFCKAVALNM